MVTATSKVACLLGLAALGLGGCGAGYGAVASSPVSGHAGSARTVAAAGAGFAWLVPAPAPPGWSVARLASGATLAYPPGWHAIHGDRGTASAALFDTAGHYLGYLNLTPRQGAESPTGWASFRVRHNRAEGDTHVAIAEARAGLRFGTARGSCVRDTYTTSARNRYVEIACLVLGRRASSVVVGAAPAGQWSSERSVIERAIAALAT